MAKRTKKNRSARDKRLARERTRRQARKLTNPLFDQPPPFKPYREWYSVPSSVKDMIEHPARRDDRLSDGAKHMVDTLIKLSPQYKGQIPLAALYLEEQINEGKVYIADNPEECHEVRLDEFARSFSDPEFLRWTREEYPEADLPEHTSLVTDDAVAFMIHSFLAQGFLVMDDDHILNLATPPTAPGDKWVLNGIEQ